MIEIEIGWKLFAAIIISVVFTVSSIAGILSKKKNNISWPERENL